MISEYWTLTKDNLLELEGRTEIKAKVLKDDLFGSIVRDSECVIYKEDGKWKTAFVSREYSVEYVMKHILPGLQR